MNRTVMLTMMMAMATPACSNGPPLFPPVDETTHDAATRDAEQPVEAGAPGQDAGSTEPPHLIPIKLGPIHDDAGDAGLEADAPSDAADGMVDAPAEAEVEAGPPPVMCCTFAGATTVCPGADAGSSVDCTATYCTVDNVVGQLAACPVCTGVVTDPTCGTDASADDAGDAAPPTKLTCGATTLTQSGKFVCVCPAATTCHYYGSTDHCSAECL